jgi:hypothetical protein
VLSCCGNLLAELRDTERRCLTLGDLMTNRDVVVCC